MLFSTINHLSYISRNYEIMIDLYNKELEKKIGENKDIDFTVDEIISIIGIIYDELDDNNEI